MGKLDIDNKEDTTLLECLVAVCCTTQYKIFKGLFWVLFGFLCMIIV